MNRPKARYFFCNVCGYGVQDLFEGNYKGKDEVLVYEKGKEWNYCPNCGERQKGRRMEIINVDNQPTLTTDVTRCSECKYYIENTCAITNEPQQEEHFCSWGSGE